jgi:hypothetical protein
MKPERDYARMKLCTLTLGVCAPGARARCGAQGGGWPAPNLQRANESSGVEFVLGNRASGKRIAADARVTALYRGERHEFRGWADVAIQATLRAARGAHVPHTQSTVSAGRTDGPGGSGRGGDAREAFDHEGATLRKIIEGLLPEGWGCAGKRA